jgi:hypothetical protein
MLGQQTASLIATPNLVGESDPRLLKHPAGWGTKLDQVVLTQEGLGQRPYTGTPDRQRLRSEIWYNDNQLSSTTNDIRNTIDVV